MKRLWKAVCSVESVGKPGEFCRHLHEAALVSNRSRPRGSPRSNGTSLLFSASNWYSLPASLRLTYCSETACLSLYMYSACNMLR